MLTDLRGELEILNAAIGSLERLQHVGPGRGGGNPSTCPRRRQETRHAAGGRIAEREIAGRRGTPDGCKPAPRSGTVRRAGHRPGRESWGRMESCGGLSTRLGGAISGGIGRRPPEAD